MTTRTTLRLQYDPEHGTWVLDVGNSEHRAKIPVIARMPDHGLLLSPQHATIELELPDTVLLTLTVQRRISPLFPPHGWSEERAPSRIGEART